VTSTGVAALIAASLTIVALPTGAGADDETPTAVALVRSPYSRVRGFDSVSRHLLEIAVACSPTVARMVVDLQSSDLIVGVEAFPLDRRTRGELRIVAVSTDVRHIRIRLRAPNHVHELVSVLGHELQHAVEVAADSEVRDAATLRRFYLRVGWEGVAGGRYETDAAREAGRVVAKEVAGCRAGEQ
jgi:hypothetical protein